MDTNDPLEVGEVLPNGGIVVDYYWGLAQSGEEPGKHGILLAILPGNHDQYVVWGFIKKESDGKIVCIHGDYCHELTEAIKVLSERGNRFMRREEALHE